MKKTAFALLVLCSFFLTACKTNVDTTTQMETDTTTADQAGTENMMDGGAQADVEAQTDTVLKAPDLQSSDDLDDISVDLNSTVVAEENFQ